jgi:hypothetical protein
MSTIRIMSESKVEISLSQNDLEEAIRDWLDARFSPPKGGWSVHMHGEMVTTDPQEKSTSLSLKVTASRKSPSERA